MFRALAMKVSRRMAVAFIAFTLAAGIMIASYLATRVDRVEIGPIVIHLAK